MVVGTVLRSHAGGYLVYQKELGLELQCAARGRLKKEKVSILAGDQVELEDIDSALLKGVISNVLPRHNMLSRPPLANIDQVVVVQAIHQPEWHPLWCDRYLVHFQLELPEASFILCFNKCDLANVDDMQKLRGVYESLGYKLIIVSARSGYGLDQLSDELRGKFSIFAGPSGVGKSSLLNVLKPGLNLKVGVMENEYGVGRHTTTASEIYRLQDEPSRTNTWLADTPGFSLAELTNSQPERIAPLFPEIWSLSTECKYADCLHIVEQGCNVLSNMEKILEDRYQSYVTLVEESKAKQKLEQNKSTKNEEHIKVVGGEEKAKRIPRLNKRYRATSRRSGKQRLGTDSE